MAGFLIDVNSTISPPWGPSSFGSMGFGNGFRHIGYQDIIRPGWSWTRPELRNSAPFCYDIVPGLQSRCYTGDVKRVCEEELGGVSAYGDRYCLSRQPFQVVGPFWWNDECFGLETMAACDAVGGFYIGESAGWCVLPGDAHTIVGPACYGAECFNEELAAACDEMGGINFADRFCLVDKSFKVVGPVCSLLSGSPISEASVCHPEETTELCDEMGGLNIGGIFCVIKGDYSVVGPFCTTQQSEESPGIIYGSCETSKGEEACRALQGRPVGNGTFCVLPGIDYKLLGPLCDERTGSCWLYNDDDNAGGPGCERDYKGTAVGAYSCLLKGDYTIIGPSHHRNVQFGGDNLLSDDLDEPNLHTILGGTQSWMSLNGSFSVIGPTCYDGTCFDGDCVQAGGSRINAIFCVMDHTGQQGGGGDGGGTIGLSAHARVVAWWISICAGLFLIVDINMV